MKYPVAITACRLLTPLDSQGASTWSAICDGQRVGAHTQVLDSLLDPDFSLDRSIRLALAVATPALSDAPRGGTSLFCGTSKGPITSLLQAAECLRQHQPLPETLARTVAQGVGAMGMEVGRRLGLPAGHTSVAACSSGLHALHRAANALWQGDCERALVVAADASLHPLFEASFQRLGVLAPALADGSRRCDPFNEDGSDRPGFFLVEAAAALLLERAPSGPPLAWLEDSWIGADATGLIAIDAHTRGLRHGLARHAWADADWGFIHAHATGTDHDAFEASALRQWAGASALPIFSHKRYLGHSLGAAGLVSAALSIACHQHRATLTGAPLPAEACHSLTIAQGFGGHIAILRLSGADS